MECHAGIDASLDLSSVCVVDKTGRIMREAKVPSEPEALVGFFDQLGVPMTRIGLAAGPLSRWPHAGLVAAGLPAVLLETRHVKAALSAMTVRSRLATGIRAVGSMSISTWKRWLVSCPFSVKPCGASTTSELTSRTPLGVGFAVKTSFGYFTVKVFALKVAQRLRGAEVARVTGERLLFRPAG